MIGMAKLHTINSGNKPNNRSAESANQRCGSAKKTHAAGMNPPWTAEVGVIARATRNARIITCIHLFAIRPVRSQPK